MPRWNGRPRPPLAALPAILLLVFVSGARAQDSTQFRFRTGFWTNLHHFLYVLGRSANGESDATRAAVAGAPGDTAGYGAVTATEQEAWSNAVRFYQGGHSRRDAIFNDTLTRTTATLARAADRSDLDGLSLDADLVRTLERVAPIYREVWWPRHARACETRTTELRAMLARHGGAIAERISLAWQEPWPDRPIVVDMTAWANWAGAYSTDRFGGLIAFSCLAGDNAGLHGLEIIFHEGMHWWDDAIQARIRRIATAEGIPAPPDLSHAMIFHTAGYAVKAVVPEHVPYGEQFGIWQRGLGRYKPILDTHWTPWLEGKTSYEQALRALVIAVARRDAR